MLQTFPRRTSHHLPLCRLVKSGTVLIVFLMLPIIAYANPQGGNVVAGSASIDQTKPASTVVTQTSQKAIINWHSFSIAQGEQTTFAQPNAQAIALNRVVGVDPSKIMGALKANGQVWLINPHGIVFGKTARVDVGGLLATTLDIRNDDFMAGNYRFRNTGNTGAMVVNAGHITVSDAGLAALVAPGVENSGIITARLGKIQLGSADGFTVDMGGDGMFNFLLDKQMAQQLVRPDGTTPTAAITNSGSLIADSGTILLTADTAKSVVDHAIDMSGYARAQGVNTQGGTIVLNGGDNGAVNVSGTLDASGNGGGTIKALGGMQDGSVNLSGTLDASAPNGGNGGFIETSAAQVYVADTAHITTDAPFGKTGTWLIDPKDFTIASTGGDMTGAALSTHLTSNNVTILSSSGSSGASGNINVNDDVSWSSNLLELVAANDINVNAVMTLRNTAWLALDPSTISIGGHLAVSGLGSITITMSRTGAISDASSYTGKIDFYNTSTFTGALYVYNTPWISLGKPVDLGIGYKITLPTTPSGIAVVEYPVAGYTTPLPAIPSGGILSFLGSSYSASTTYDTSYWGFQYLPTTSTTVSSTQQSTANQVQSQTANPPIIPIPTPKVSPTSGMLPMTLGNGQKVFVDNQGNFFDGNGNPVSAQSIASAKKESQANHEGLSTLAVLQQVDPNTPENKSYQIMKKDVEKAVNTENYYVSITTANSSGKEVISGLGQEINKKLNLNSDIAITDSSYSSNKVTSRSSGGNGTAGYIHPNSNQNKEGWGECVSLVVALKGVSWDAGSWTRSAKVNVAHGGAKHGDPIATFTFNKKDDKYEYNGHHAAVFVGYKYVDKASKNIVGWYVLDQNNVPKYEKPASLRYYPATRSAAPEYYSFR